MTRIPFTARAQAGSTPEDRVSWLETDSHRWDRLVEAAGAKAAD